MRLHINYYTKSGKYIQYRIVFSKKKLPGLQFMNSLNNKNQISLHGTSCGYEGSRKYTYPTLTKANLVDFNVDIHQLIKQCNMIKFIYRYSLYVHKSKHSVLLSICLENVNTKQTQLRFLPCLPWIIKNEASIFKAMKQTKYFSPRFTYNISLVYGTYIPTFVTN